MKELIIICKSTDKCLLSCFLLQDWAYYARIKFPRQTRIMRNKIPSSGPVLCAIKSPRQELTMRDKKTYCERMKFSRQERTVRWWNSIVRSVLYADEIPSSGAYCARMKFPRLERTVRGWNSFVRHAMGLMDFSSWSAQDSAHIKSILLALEHNLTINEKFTFNTAIRNAYHTNFTDIFGNC